MAALTPYFHIMAFLAALSRDRIGVEVDHNFLQPRSYLLNMTMAIVTVFGRRLPLMA